VIDEMGYRYSSNYSFGQQSFPIGSLSRDVTSHAMFAHNGGNYEFFAIAGSENRWHQMLMYCLPHPNN
jgi:hypothetical protein